MGRPRNPERDKSMQRYLDADGKIETAELAKLAGVPEVRIRKWKSEDGWDEALKKKPKKRGGQKGNKNAAGKTPAKKGNKNAVTHGAFAQAGYEDIDPEQAAAIKNMGTPSALSQMMEELQALYVRKAYLESLLKEYESKEAGGFYTDKIVHMIVPKSMEERREEEDCGMEQGIDDTFSDIAELEACCKFSDCRHETEPGCAIRAAIADGILSRDRYELYRSLHEESRHAAKMKDISKWRKQLKR